MATTVSRFSLFVPLLLVLLATLYEPTRGIVGGVNSNYRTIAASGGGSTRSLLGIQRNNRIVDCSEMALKSQCSQYSSKCRWCRSEALDDMCFSKSEAWRLPPQVFSCE